MAELGHLSPFNRGGHVKNRHVTVSYLVFPPYILSAGSIPTGLDVDILNDISSRLNIAFTYVQSNSFPALIGNLLKGKADMCVSQPSLTLGRANMGLEFFFTVYRSFIFAHRHPAPISSFNTVSQPFSSVVWGLIACSVIALATSFMILNR